ncbi:MAG: M14 family metallopeptidase [Anaerolineales bacterium]
MSSITSLFPTTYESSRERFRGYLPTIQTMWSKAALHQHVMSFDNSLTIDWIYSPATEKNEKILVFTTGEHGVECYVGAAMMHRFVEDYMPKLDPRTTGILLVHAINPWGMKNHRRGNKDNIDLNRTFMLDPQFDPTFNTEYEKLDAFLNPKGQLQSTFFSNIAYLLGLAYHIAKVGMRNFRFALLLGQYRNPQGLYYGGKEMPEETRTIMDLYKMALRDYDQVLHLDMHTGYGPRYQMSLVNSALDKGTSEYFEQRFNYPLVVAATADEFYAIRGDMIDYIYGLQQRDHPTKRLYATSFEFGTLGDTLYGLFQSPRVMIHENRAFWHGASNDQVHAEAKRGFEELFNPSAADWKEKAVRDAEQAFEGILKAEGFV